MNTENLVLESPQQPVKLAQITLIKSLNPRLSEIFLCYLAVKKFLETGEPVSIMRDPFMNSEVELYCLRFVDIFNRLGHVNFKKAYRELPFMESEDNLKSKTKNSYFNSNNFELVSTALSKPLSYRQFSNPHVFIHDLHLFKDTPYFKQCGISNLKKGCVSVTASWDSYHSLPTELNRVSDYILDIDLDQEVNLPTFSYVKNRTGRVDESYNP